MQDLLKNYPVVIEIPIAWGDMDAFQHVNNIMYFRYFESARIAYFEKLNFIEQMKKTGIGPILANTQCKFKIPLSYTDQVSVGAKVDVIEKDRFLMKYLVVSHKHKNIAAVGEGMLDLKTSNCVICNLTVLGMISIYLRSPHFCDRFFFPM